MYGDSVETKINELAGVEARYEAAVREAASEDWDIIVVIGWGFAQYLETVAPTAPDKRFVIIDSSLPYDDYDLSNCIAVTFKANEGSYLAGAVAASISTTGHIGAIGGQETPMIQDFMIGYVEGALEVNPDIKVSISWVGNYADSARGKELALAQMNNGVDVCFQIAGGAGLGVIEAAVEMDRYAIGVDSDQAMLFDESDPDKAAAIPTSMIKDVGGAIFEIVTMDMEGTVAWGSPLSLGVRESTTGVAKNKYYEQMVPKAVQDVVDAMEAKIRSGDTVVTTAYGMTPDAIDEIFNAVKP